MVVVTAIILAAALVMRMGMRGAIGMGVCMGVLVLVVVITAIVFATALVMLVGMRGAVSMGVCMRVFVLMVVVAAIVFAAALGVFVRMRYAISMCMRVSVLCSHDLFPLLNGCSTTLNSISLAVKRIISSE